MAKDHDKEESQGSHGGGGGHGPGGHGGGEHEESGAPEWLISFADNVALLMGFFVILLAMNMKEPTAGGIGGKEKNGGAPASMTNREMDVIIGIREAFNQPIMMDSEDPREQQLARRKREQKLAGQSQQHGEPDSGRENQVKIPTQMSAMGGLVPFEDDSEALSESGRARAEQIGRTLKGMRFIIEVRGHASPSEAVRDPERANLLGFRRAMAVARVLETQGVTWEQMRVSSAGAVDRQTGREYDRDANRVNQRVEIIVTGDPVP
jgi:outer membrane protein OmpA-like peptidoglycan-associated protein